MLFIFLDHGLQGSAKHPAQKADIISGITRHAIPAVPKSVKCAGNHDGKIDCFHFVSLFQAQIQQRFCHTISFSSGLTGALIAQKHRWRNGNSMH